MKKAVSHHFVKILFVSLMAFMLLVSVSSCDSKAKKYQAAIATADSAFQAKQYNKAMNWYGNAKNIKADETYPDEQIKKIKKILAQTENDKKYLDVIKKADELFAEKRYEESRLAFLNASRLKPAEDYPKEKIAELDVILAKIAEEMAALNQPYFIIVGCFEIESNATKLNKLLKDEGYESIILPDYLGKYSAVTIGSYDDLKEAWNKLPAILDMELFWDDTPWVLKYSDE
jgi:tetratricopeptide (TPR) repeat protein